MKKILLFLFLFFSIKTIYAQLGFEGHIPATTLPYTPSGYSAASTMRQGSSVTNASKFHISNADNTLVYVNFNFATDGKSVYLVYTTDGSQPSKTVGTSVSCSFSNFFSPNRTWVGTIPSTANVAGTTIRYIFYISDNSLANSWGRIASSSDGSGYSTSWTEGDASYSYIVASATTGSGGLWSNTGSWQSGSVPNATSIPVEIQNGATVTLDNSYSSGGIYINSGGTFTATDGSARTLTISNSSSTTAASRRATIINNGTWQNGAGTSTIIFTGSPSGGDAGHTVSGTVAFQNITVEKSGGTSNVGVSFGANSSISGTFKVGTGGYVSSAPPTGFYGSAAILKFDQGSGATYDVGASDNSWSTTQVPNNITISSGTVNLNANRTAPGNLLIDGGALVLNLNTPTLTIQGNWTRTSGSFSSGTGTVAFTGTTNTIVNTATPANLYNLTVNKTSGANVSLSSSVIVGNTLTLTAGSLSIAANTLTLNGTATGSGTLTGSTSSNITLNGSGALGTLNFDQTADGTTNVLNSFTINRASSGSVTLGNKLVVTNTITLTDGTLTTGGFLHLRSNSSGTARVAAITGTGVISGNVTVERYIPGNRKWRSLSVPLIGSSNNTIYNNWQNNGTPAGSTGVELWKPGANTATDGFTAAGGTANILTYTGGNSGSGSGGYTPVSNTKTQVLFDATGPKPFLVYATGPYGSSNVTSGFAETTLKATGTLVQGSGNFGYTGMATGYWFVTNPYPSAIDFASIGKTNVNNIIYMWDPLLTGMNGQGNYQTTNDGTTVPQGGSYSGNSTIIPNGASFFVYSTGSGSLSFSESNKVTGDFNVFGRGNANGQEVFRANILIPSTTDVLNDGVATVFGASYSSTPSNEDAVKFNSPTNGIAIRRANNNYAIELRPYITSNDTMFLRLLNMNQTNYKLELKAEYFDANSGLEAFLKDTYTNTTTPVSLTADTYYNFTVDANAASTGDRFMVVFRNTNPLPVKITSIKATQKATTVVVDWTVENEVNIASYEVLKSTDGRNFETLNTVNANNSKAYNSIDNAPSQSANYYRVVSIGNDDKKQYSNIVLVKFGVKNSEVAIYPNPLKGNTINLQLQNIDKGDYELQIINIIGQVLYSKVIQHNGGNATQTVQLPSNVAKGNYVLKLANKEAIIYSEKIILE
ncbi:MAG: T9SS type A sorting domain-containing protein [Chitinophagaceae bacterium]|nr:T9SS type A sorting domain-containing protein [Chitinophagaceae bacterium]